MQTLPQTRLLIASLFTASVLLFSSCSEHDITEESETGTLQITPQVSMDVVPESNGTKANTVYGMETNDFGVFITGTDYNNSSYKLGTFPAEGILMPAGDNFNLTIDSGWIGVIDGDGNSDYRGAGWDTPFYKGAYNPFSVTQNNVTTLSFAILQTTVLIDVEFIQTGDDGIPADYETIEAEVTASWADKHLKYTPAETRTGHFIADLKMTTPPATSIADYGTDTYTVVVNLVDAEGVLPTINKTFTTAELTANHKYTFEIKMDITKTKLDVNVIDVAAQVESPITLYI
ncbi:hypothetical protein [Marinifilum flexuosum]|uniref:Fimbrillin-like protein n=1 Tax=Marinifilum flexuosum TaxID=1117708 RepID=A0A419X4Q7_9BACT|nr:hypothetical protein [Marinifilum flexuosum]RKE02590.1 hypothetical protein BXY64_2685 [Marinifilum flexuosum]